MKTYATKLIQLISGAAPYQSTETFSELFDRTHLIVFRYIYGLSGGTAQDIEDLTAETFLRAWRSRRRFHGDEDAVVGWLLQIARRLVIDQHRRRKARVSEVEMHEDMADSVSPEAVFAENEQQRRLLTLIQHLPTEQREMLVLRYMLGWRVNQIAAHMRMNENTISVTLRRILMKLQANWSREEQNHGGA